MSHAVKKLIWCLGCILGLFLGLDLVRGSSPSPEIAWVDDVDQALQLAKTHNKPVLLHFYGDHCPPCRMLEAKAFRDGNLVSTFNDHVIAVKINADKQRPIAQQYQVTRWPTDVYLYPDGNVIERGVCNQDPQAYARTIQRVNQRHQDWVLSRVADRELIEKREQLSADRSLGPFKARIFRESSRKTTPVRVSAATWKLNSSDQASGEAAPSIQRIDVAKELEVAQAPSTPSALSPNHSEGPLPTVVIQTPPPAKRDPQQVFAELAATPALNGYCPVTLQDFLRMPADAQSRNNPWVLGKESFAVRHRGRIYRCVSEEMRQRFLRDPDAYAPMLSGCDAVEFARSGELVNGLCEFGFIEQNTGRVFLFASRANYDAFARQFGQQPSSSEPQKERVAEDETPLTVR